MALLMVSAPELIARPGTEILKVSGFGNVTLYAPDSEPTQVVLFVSGDGGWNLGVVAMAERLRSLGALVAGIDIRSMLKSLEGGSDCAYPAGALEELSRTVQLHSKVRAYRRPILVGYSSGATLVYATLVAAPPETFAGAISMGFCPDIELSKPLCPSRGLRALRKAKGIGFNLEPYALLSVPWMVLQGDIDQVCDAAATQKFVAATGSARLFRLPRVGHGFGVPRDWEPQFIEAFRAIANRKSSDQAYARAPAVADLSLLEVPGSQGAHPDVFAIILTGDGGWADLDKSVASGLAKQGIPTIGWSSLSYYWTPRTPEGAASDLARIITHYATTWNRKRVVLVGYSFGADVLPFLANRLPADTAHYVAAVALLGPSNDAIFDFRVTDWLTGGRKASYKTGPEIEKLRIPVVCVQGADEQDSVCRTLQGAQVRVESLGRGHHFSGQYDRIVNAIIGLLQ